MKKRVLLVEDEPGLVMTLTDRLSEEGYRGRERRKRRLLRWNARAAASFDLIILDVMLPYSNGFDVCRDLRHRGIKTPVLCSPPKARWSTRSWD